ncbi:MAG: ATPase, T2SS/T4P/T4SS family [Phycisphaerae bacterium]
MAERLFTTYQIAELLQTTPSTVVEWMEKGWLPFKRMPEGPVRIAERQLIQFLKNQGIDLAQILAKIAGDNGDSEGEYLSEQTGSEQYEQRRTMSLPMTTTEPEEQQGDTEQAAEREAPAETFEEVEEPVEAPDAAAEAPAVETVADEPEQPAEVGEAQEPPREQPTVPAAPDALVEAMLRDALECGSEYVHLEPTRDGYAVRLRLGRMLVERRRYAERLSGEGAREFAAHVKTLAGIPADSGQRPVRGCFARAVDGRQVEVAVGTCPVAGGEKLLLQVASCASPPALAELGMSEQDISRLRAATGTAGGLVLVTAPPRNGRRTTLRSLTAERVGRAVMSVELPPSTAPAGIGHIPVGDGGAPFAEAVRAAAAMDCDVLMVEDLSEPSVAQAAVAAAGGGTLVVAGMRAGEPAESIAELLSMGAGGWELSRLLRCVVVQRSVATLCDACRREVTVSDEQLAAIGLETGQTHTGAYAPVGCELCDQAGYTGRTAVFAVVEPTETLRLAIRSSADVGVIRDALVGDARKLLATAAVEKLRTGITSAAEAAEALEQ